MIEIDGEFFEDPVRVERARRAFEALRIITDVITNGNCFSVLCALEVAKTITSQPLFTPKFKSGGMVIYPQTSGRMILPPIPGVGPFGIPWSM